MSETGETAETAKPKMKKSNAQSRAPSRASSRRKSKSSTPRGKRGSSNTRQQNGKGSRTKGHKGKPSFRHGPKKTPLASQDSIIPRYFVAPCGDDLQVMSTAAKGTTVRFNSTMCVDAGNLPVALAKDVKLLMVTHGHADHMKDICNAFHDRDGKILIVFCPAIMAHDLFCTIRYTYQANKGREYPAQEILDHLQIYAVVRPNDTTFDDQDEVIDPISRLPIATLVQCGSTVELDLGGREKCAVKPFHCHHTVDTVGYGIYKTSRRLNRTITIPQGTMIQLTPPKMTKAEKAAYKKAKAAAVAKAREEGKPVPDVNLLMNRVNFDVVTGFCEALDIPIDTIKTSIVSCEMDNGFVLDSIRQIEFQANVEFDCFEDDDCVLPPHVFHFFKEYETDMQGVTQLDIYHKVMTPSIMVFGDTAASVFSQKLVRDMVSEFPRVVIECTFLDGEDVLSQIGAPKGDDPDLSEGDGCCSSKKVAKKATKNAKRNLYLRLKEKKHIFLPELFHIFAKHPDTEFVLMHFSDRYDRETVQAYIADVQSTYPNVFAAV